MKAFQARQVHLYVDLPHADETWASFFDRVCATYRLDRFQLFAQLAPDRRQPRWPETENVLATEIHESLLRALGVSSRELPNMLRGIRFESLAPRRRTAYCPLCFLDDLAKRRTPYFRFQWSIPLITGCTTHGTPLATWRSARLRDQRNLPLAWALTPEPSVASACLWLDEDLRNVARYGPDQLPEYSPWHLVRRFGEELIKFDPSQASWWDLAARERMWAIERALTLGEARMHASMRPLAEFMKPKTSDNWLFDGPADDQLRRLFPTRKMIRFYPVGWRRSLLWFAARCSDPSRSAREAWTDLAQAAADDSVAEEVGEVQALFNAT